MFTSGGLAAFVTCPIDVIKTLRQKHQTEGMADPYLGDGTWNGLICLILVDFKMELVSRDPMEFHGINMYIYIYTLYIHIV